MRRLSIEQGHRDNGVGSMAPGPNVDPRTSNRIVVRRPFNFLPVGIEPDIRSPGSTPRYNRSWLKRRPHIPSREASDLVPKLLLDVHGGRCLDPQPDVTTYTEREADRRGRNVASPANRGRLLGRGTGITVRRCFLFFVVRGQYVLDVIQPVELLTPPTVPANLVVHILGHRIDSRILRIQRMEYADRIAVERRHLDLVLVLHLARRPDELSAQPVDQPFPRFDVQSGHLGGLRETPPCGLRQSRMSGEKADATWLWPPTISSGVHAATPQPRGGKKKKHGDDSPPTVHRP